MGILLQLCLPNHLAQLSNKSCLFWLPQQSYSCAISGFYASIMMYWHACLLSEHAIFTPIILRQTGVLIALYQLVQLSEKSYPHTGIHVKNLSFGSETLFEALSGHY